MFFKKEKHEDNPKAGESWYLRSDKSPWPSDRPPVTIRDCRDGWVRYSFGTVFTDERMKLESFKRCYLKGD